MSIVWGLISLIACLATGWMVFQIEKRPRPADVAFALLAPICALIAFLALISVFVPGFLTLGS